MPAFILEVCRSCGTIVRKVPLSAIDNDIYRSLRREDHKGCKGEKKVRDGYKPRKK